MLYEILINLQKQIFKFLAGYKLMKLVGADDLTKRIGPRLDKFHSVDTTGLYKGVVYWRKTFLYPGFFSFSLF